MVYWSFNIYPYYAFPMQGILPIIIFILTELKSLKCDLTILPMSNWKRSIVDYNFKLPYYCIMNKLNTYRSSA